MFQVAVKDKLTFLFWLCSSILILQILKLSFHKGKLQQTAQANHAPAWIVASPLPTSHCSFKIHKNLAVFHQYYFSITFFKTNDKGSHGNQLKHGSVIKSTVKLNKKHVLGVRGTNWTELWLNLISRHIDLLRLSYVPSYFVQVSINRVVSA